MISSVRAQTFVAPAAASRAKPSALNLPAFNDHRVEEVVETNPSGDQHHHESFSYNDLSRMAANLVIEAEVEAAHERLAVEAGAEPEAPEIIAAPGSPHSPDTGDHLGDGGATDHDILEGSQDRRAAGPTEHDAPPQGSLADDTTVVVNDFAPAPGLDVVTGRQDMRHAAKAYESVLATVGGRGMHPGDVLDGNL